MNCYFNTPVDRLCPPPQLCSPGELRQEFEEQVNKLMAERRAREEEENRASENFIQKLLAEEQEQQMYAEQKKKEMDEQLKRDEQLAKMLSEEVNLKLRTAPESVGCAKSTLRFNSSTSKGAKLTVHSHNNMNDIQRYLSPTIPKYQTAEISGWRTNASDPVSTSVGDDLITSNDSMTSIHLFNCDKGTEPDSSSDQSELVHFSEGTPKEAFTFRQIEECTSLEQNENEIPGASSSNAQNDGDKEDVPLKKLKRNSINCNEDRLDSTIVPILTHKLEHACTSAGCCNLNNVDYATVQNLMQDKGIEQDILNQSLFPATVVKRKACNSSVSAPISVVVKKRKITFDEPSQIFNENLANWEREHVEKCRMEEQDRLLALKLQKELDKESQTINRTRGTPDEYLLRTKKLPTNCEEKMLEKCKTALAAPKDCRVSRGSQRSDSGTLELCNKQAMFKNNSSKTSRQKSRILQDPTKPFFNQKDRYQRPFASMDANTAAMIPVSELRNRTKQQTIVNMFQKYKP
ncbi:E3 ubiquitin-protein ligase rnf168 isoform X2 [Narcine bancroftii]|uniref:E3 ubiquitin-protein ligase rnf168 isoform X2 n=1 Tax=Narcine bancroftii TaxID=1343680 RepID=UPI0038319B98